MRDLEKHIARLLLDNDCVIVPGFGGFMAHSIPAKYDEDTCLFTPPIRIVGFNPQLTMNDSLLVQRRKDHRLAHEVGDLLAAPAKLRYFRAVQLRQGA